MPSKDCHVIKKQWWLSLLLRLEMAMACLGPSIGEIIVVCFDEFILPWNIVAWNIDLLIHWRINYNNVWFSNESKFLDNIWILEYKMKLYFQWRKIKIMIFNESRFLDNIWNENIVFVVRNFCGKIIKDFFLSFYKEIILRCECESDFVSNIERITRFNIKKENNYLKSPNFAKNISV